MAVDVVFHYPADLMNLLVETIPLLNKSKKDVFLFFKGAGVPDNIIAEIKTKWEQNKDDISKYEIVRSILTKLNQGEDKYIRERREIIKRVTEFDSFSNCWEQDVLKAKGLVADIKQITGLKDSVTKIAIDLEKRRQEDIRAREAEIAKVIEKKKQIDQVKKTLYALFAETNPQARGKALEAILNNFFKAFGISVREAFVITGVNNEGIVEQIDGVIEFDNDIYLVEMKWWSQPIGVPEITQHIGRLFLRSVARGIFISASGYTDTAITCCRDALQQKIIFLMSLEEIVSILENDVDFLGLLKQKTHAAIIDKIPWLQRQY